MLNAVPVDDGHKGHAVQCKDPTTTSTGTSTWRKALLQKNRDVDPDLDPHSFEFLEPDPDLHLKCGSGSESRRAKMTHKYEKNKEFMPDVLFWGLKASPVACASFMEA
jgi:hypothetical protein